MTFESSTIRQSLKENQQKNTQNFEAIARINADIIHFCKPWVCNICTLLCSKYVELYISTSVVMFKHITHLVMVKKRLCFDLKHLILVTQSLLETLQMSHQENHPVMVP